MCSINCYQVLPELFDSDCDSESFFTGPLPDHLFDRAEFDATSRLPTLLESVHSSDTLAYPGKIRGQLIQI